MLSSDALKIIALISMFIDHFGAIVVGGGLMEWIYPTASSIPDGYFTFYYILRTIGRLAFPIYCYLLVTGFQYTGNPKKYTLRMILFAFLSELPFDLALNGNRQSYMSSQNVFFTLAVGLIVLMGIHKVEQAKGNRPLQVLLTAAVTIAGMTLCGLLNTDYSYKGIVLIALLYLFRYDRLKQCTIAPLGFLLAHFLILLTEPELADTSLASIEQECFCIVSFLLIYYCNNKRRIRINKYFFYIFYPAHILLLYIINLLLYKTA